MNAKVAINIPAAIIPIKAPEDSFSLLSIVMVGAGVGVAVGDKSVYLTV